MSPLLVVVLVLAVAVAVRLARRLVHLVLLLRRQRALTADMSGPRPYPLVGNFLELAGPQEKMFGRLTGLLERYGGPFRFWLGPKLVVFLLDPDDCRVVFTSPHLADKESQLYDAMLPVIGQGLINLNGDAYRRHRRVITASLHTDMLQEFVQVFADNGRQLGDRLATLAATGEVFDVAPLMGWCASNTVCETVLGAEAPGLEHEKEAFVRMVHAANPVMLYRALRPWYASTALFRLCSAAAYREYQDAVQGMTSFAEKLLGRKMEQLKQGGTTAPKRDRKTFLDEVLASQGVGVEEGAEQATGDARLSRTELLDELKTLSFAGAATSMDTQSFLLVCMSLLPEVQRKVQEELDAVLGPDPSRDIEAADLPHLEYLDRVLKETLRYFPPAPMFARQVNQDVHLPSGYVLPQGAAAIIVPMMVHRDPNHFPDPMTFDPDRFLPENCVGRHPFAYIPFSAGTRSCIGRRYAMMFGKTLAASVLRRYDVLPDPRGPQRLQDIQIVAGIAMSIHGGARIRLRAR